MRILLLLSLMCLTLTSVGGTAKAQSKAGVAVSYLYMDAEEWDRIIQTYNFSRPWLDEAQPTLSSGLLFEAQITIPLDSGVAIGLQGSYGVVCSEAPRVPPAPEELRIRLDIFTVAVRLEIYPFVVNGADTGDSWERYLFFSIAPGLTFAAADFALDGEPLRRDGVKLESTGTGFDLGLGIGADLPLYDNITLAPSLMLHWMPDIDLENFDVNLHNTSLVGLQTSGSVLTVSSGVALRMAW